MTEARGTARRYGGVPAVVDLTFAVRPGEVTESARPGIAGALPGDPPVLILDAPLDGLDPEGIVRTRGLTLRMAAEGGAGADVEPSDRREGVPHGPPRARAPRSVSSSPPHEPADDRA
ncbi:hypothetical protein ACWC4E_32040 [Streptomyces sp. NPDC001273]